MKKILLSMIIFLGISSAAVAAYKIDIATRFIQYSDFIEVKESIYICPATTKKQRRKLLELVESAKERIIKTFGEFTASPVIIYCQEPQQRKKYSKNSYAVSKLMPFSQNKAYIVIGENGHNLDIVAHELVHAEVFHRIGYYNQMVNIPVWFNEGVAMQVDYREKYSTPQKTRKDLSQLKYSWQFFEGDLTAHYSLAKSEVKKWLNSVGYKKFYQVLDTINSGSGFNEIYAGNIEKS